MSTNALSSVDIAAQIDFTRTKNRLTWYEDQIRTRAKSLAAIFIELRNDPVQPWRIAHDSYEDYCREVWSMSPRRIQQIAAGESVKALLASEAPDLALVVQAMPEGQVRALATAPQDRRADVLRDAVALPGKMTANKIKQAKARVISTEENLHTELPGKENCPHCGRPMP